METWITNAILKNEIQLLVDAYKKSIEEIQNLPHLNNIDADDRHRHGILGILENNMQDVINKYPDIGNLL